ncbi:MAG: hypothetical protein IJZ23_09790 [Roseburia sp.]|nr:hypothetical protein [Roseburia sp.]
MDMKCFVGDWLYFCPEEITVRDLYEVFAGQDDVEIWEEAGVLEIPLGEKSSFDVETAQIHPKDEITRQFANEQGAKCVFLATFIPEDYDKAEQIMKQILGKFGGLFCGDTEDFMPQKR